MPNRDPKRGALSVEEFRAAAADLLAAVTHADPEIAREATARFRAVPALASRQTFTKRDAMAVIGAEAGFPTRLRGEPGRFDPASLFTGRADEYLNFWCRTYEEAKSVQQSQPEHILFPFGNQFVLVEPSLLRYHSINDSDPDWAAIGRDWVCPLDAAAHARLEAKLLAAAQAPKR